MRFYRRLYPLIAAAFVSLSWSGAARAEPDPPPPPPPAPVTMTAEEITAMVEENKRLKAAAGNPPKPEPPKPDPKDQEDPLRRKAADGKATAEETARETRRIESALTFNLGIDTFIKTNKDLLPKEIEDIVKVAHKESYDSAQAKANALKSAMIQAYFSVQDNVDALTRAQKDSLDDYLKLTKTGKEDKAAQVYETIFEPALETVRKVKKAEELGRSRSGLATGTDAENAYKTKLIKGSRKTYLGEKEG